MKNTETETEILIKMSGIKKTYGQTEVLHGVSLDVKKGEVHALMGENGAGKSTMVKILMGEVRMDAGEIFIDGNLVRILNPSDAHSKGLRMIHQEILLMPDMSVAENIFVGMELRKGLFVCKSAQEKAAQKILDDLGICIKASEKVRTLKTAQRQMVEIAKAVSFGAKLIIMDEPTSSISRKETEILFSIIRRLKKQNISFIYISHRMEEIFEIADSVTVMRDGTVTGSGLVKFYNTDKLISQMVGRTLDDYFPRKNTPVFKEIVLKVEKFSRKNEYQNITFDLHKGEILGLGGLIGAGRTELVSSIFGIIKPDEGKLLLKGKQIVISDTANAIRQGMALIPEDRKQMGLNLTGSILDNIMMVVEKCDKQGIFISHTKRRKKAAEVMKKLSVKAESLEQVAGNLSGGNQQKVVVAKWLLEDSDILILDEPTRGIDVGAKAEIYKLIVQMAEAGKSIILISSEMSELIGLCDRIIVMYEGKITGSLNRSEVSQEKIMALASNIKEKGRNNE